MTWNPFRRRGEILRARNEEIEQQVREALSTPAPDQRPAVALRDRADLVRRIKAVLAA